ncbi:MAG: hypothetical protein O9302_10955 [Cyclobacteriaceae bacterium]|jgi:hypothetical protein|nr:hypothetical protein [Flammeovirgaceae bacterium]MCZ8021086.1 hypothetical protein [Cytophagales bacterium]MCZ8328569.1 hypothetical protein [Cyclobacteriaceae bacterium]
MTAQKTAIAVLQQLKEITDQLTETQFVQPITALGNASLAKHLRHTIEFFLCLQAGCKTGTVNYDNREHNTLLENNKSMAVAVLEELQKNIIKQTHNVPLKLEVTYGIQEINNEVVQTNYTRELMYNIEHAIHHMAIFKIGLNQVAPQVKLPEDFGVASSTIRYNQEAAVTTS